MKSIVLVSLDPELIADTRDACKARRMRFSVEAKWKDALDKGASTDLMIVDLLATLSQPHRIEGYVRFAESKMASRAQQTPIALIGVPNSYRMDGMVGWEGFLTAYVERPVDDECLNYLLDYA